MLADLTAETQQTYRGLGRMLFTFLTVGSGLAPNEAKSAVRKVFPE